VKAGLYALYARLADGAVHNGAALAEEFELSRAAVWKRMQGLRELGLEIIGTAGDGYRLPHAVELLDIEQLRTHLRTTAIQVDVAGAVDSTSARLTELEDTHAHALVAEAQTAGRGRRGRGWQSPPGSGLYLSMGWRFESGLAGLAPLSLVVGLSAAKCLRRAGADQARVKWPNDLFIADAKVGGCLVEVSGAAEGPCRAIVGIGINLFATPAMDGLDQRWTVLEEHAPTVERNRLAAALIDELAAAFAAFDDEGFDSALEAWPDFDALEARVVDVLVDGRRVASGRATGVDRQGRLRLETEDGARHLAAGEVSIRAR
jgi:BirA family biotin operon repressor/biotin-[acetyl-CoA-carboxylase] ligase